MSTPDDSIPPNDADATPYWALPAIQCLAAFQFEPAGSLEPMCRKCGTSFRHPDKPPRKCEHCEAPIRQKRRSFDGQFVYVNEVDTERLLLEGRVKDTWALISNANAALYDDTASKLEGQLHRWPLHVEVLAHVLTELQRRAWQARNFAYFSGLFAQRGLLRWRAGDTRGALDLVLQTCYLDACGPRNSAIDFEPDSRHGAVTDVAGAGSLSIRSAVRQKRDSQTGVRFPQGCYLMSTTTARSLTFEIRNLK